MKKTIMLLVIAVMFFSSALAEPSLHCNLNIVHSDFHRDITADLFVFQGQTYIQSSLFPDRLFRTDPFITMLLSSAKTFRFLSPGALHKACMRAEQDMIRWIKELPTEKTTGIYSGELFDTATSRSSFIFAPDHLEMFLKSQIALQIKKKEPDYQDLSYMFLLSAIASQIKQISDKENLSVQAGLYDEDRFLSLNIKSNQDTVMTVSLDFSSDESIKALTTFKEEKQYRMIEYTLLFSENQAETCIKHFLSAIPYYRLIYNSDPVYSAAIKLSDTTNNSISFTCDFAFHKLSNSFAVYGDITDDTINGYAHFSKENQSAAEICLKLKESDQIQSADGREIIEATDLESEKQIRQSIWTGVLPVIIDILPYLPAEYSELLIELTQ